MSVYCFKSGGRTGAGLYASGLYQFGTGIYQFGAGPSTYGSGVFGFGLASQIKRSVKKIVRSDASDKEVGVDKSKLRVVRRKIGGQASLDTLGSPSKLNDAQLQYAAKLKEKTPHGPPPVFDRHEVNLFADVIQSKQILGSGMMKY